MAGLESRELLLRVASAAVLLPVALGAIWLGSWTFGLLMALLCGLMAREWLRLCGVLEGNKALLVTTLALTPLTVLAAQAAAPWTSAVLLVCGAVICAVVARWEAKRAALAVAAGVIYIGMTGDSAAWLRSHAPQGDMIILWLLVSVVATDVGAFVSGRMIGGPKLAPRISPNKTWAGLLGGMAWSAIAGAALAVWLGGQPVLAAGCGAVLAVVAQAGDLLESWMKRRVGLKDSGRSIPGHGGVLDRLDGFLAATPVMGLLVLVLDGAPIL